MKKLVYYSDCFIFGGCEKLLLNLITSKEINVHYDVHYAYARNSDYQKGVDLEVPSTVRRYALAILDNHNLFYRIDRSRLHKILGFCLKIPFALIERAGLYSFYNFFCLFSFFKRHKPDVLHINNGGYPAARSCLVAVVSAYFAGVPKVIFTVNNLAQKQTGFFDKCVDWFVGRHVDQFVTASTLAGKMLFENRGFALEKIVQIYNGIPAESPAKNRSELLQIFSISAEKFIIVTVALLTERKGQMCLLKAFDTIRNSYQTAFDGMVLFLVGEGEDRFIIEKYISEQGLVESVILTGQRSDYYDFIYSSDVFVLPSLRDEDMPLVILSAMGCGKAIVSTRVAGITEQVRDGIDGIIVNPGDVDALAAAIMRFYRVREMGASCGAHAMDRFENCFSLDRLVESYLILYGELTHE